MNQCSIVLQSHNWTPVSSDIAIEGSIAIQGCFSRVPSLAYFYGVEIFSNAPRCYTYEEPKLRTEKLTSSIKRKSEFPQNRIVRKPVISNVLKIIPHRVYKKRIILSCQII